jgi:hypothetical protein
MESEGYSEIKLWNNHTLKMWTSGSCCILEHPMGCLKENDDCLEKIIKYIHNEGIFDKMLDKQVVLIDSYIEVVE